MSECGNDIEVEVHDKLKQEVRMEITDVFEQFIDGEGVHERDAHIMKHEEINLGFLVTKVEAEQLPFGSFTKEMPLVLDMVCDEMKLEEKLGILDISKDEIRIHEREEYRMKQEESVLDSLVAEVKEIRLSSASPTKEITELHSLKSNFGATRLVQFDCDTGGENLGKNNSINYNIMEHKCHFCKYTSIDRNHLATHIRSVHSNIVEHNYAASRKEKLKTHVKSTHFKIKKYECHLCKYATNLKNNLRYHIDDVHSNIKKN